MSQINNIKVITLTILITVYSPLQFLYVNSVSSNDNMSCSNSISINSNEKMILLLQVAHWYKGNFCCHYRTPVTSLAAWVEVLLRRRAAVHFWSNREHREMGWAVASLSSCPVWRPRAEPIFLSWASATSCQLSRDSMATGINAIPCWRQSSSAPPHLPLISNGRSGHGHGCSM